MKKDERRKQYRDKVNRLYKDNCTPVNEAKNATVKTLAEFGKNHKILRIPVAIVLVAFIFVYNFFLYTFLHLHVRKKYSRVLAAFMCLVLIITSINLTGLAFNKKEVKTIVAFDSVESIEAEYGTSIADLKLPATVSAYVEVETYVSKTSDNQVTVDPALDINTDSSDDSDDSGSSEGSTGAGDVAPVEPENPTDAGVVVPVEPENPVDTGDDVAPVEPENPVDTGDVTPVDDSQSETAAPVETTSDSSDSSDDGDSEESVEVDIEENQAAREVTVSRIVRTEENAVVESTEDTSDSQVATDDTSAETTEAAPVETTEAAPAPISAEATETVPTETTDATIAEGAVTEGAVLPTGTEETVAPTGDVVIPLDEAVESAEIAQQQAAEAAEEAALEYVLESVETVREDIAVTWECANYNSTIPGTYVFTSKFADENYKLAEGVVMPAIEVTVLEEGDTYFTTVIDNVEITMHAVKGVFPAGSSMVVNKIADPNALVQVAQAIENTAEENETTSVEGIVTFDITVVDGLGNEIQPVFPEGVDPASAVTVTFKQVVPVVESQASAEVVEETTSENLEVYYVSDDFTQAESQNTTVDHEDVSFNPQHFSVYSVVLQVSHITIQIEDNSKIEIALAYGNTDVDVSEYEDEILAALQDPNVVGADKIISPSRVEFVKVDANAQSTQDEFPWWKYDTVNKATSDSINESTHTYLLKNPQSQYNSDKYVSLSDLQSWDTGFNDSKYSGADIQGRHIINLNAAGSEMLFIGYGRNAWQDFYYLPNEQKTKKQIEYTMTEAPYDALNGIGFLVNATINGTSYDNQTVSGYLLFFKYGGSNYGQSIQVFSLNNVSVKTMHNATSFFDTYGNPAIPGMSLLATQKTGTSNQYYVGYTKARRKVKIEVMPTYLKVWLASSQDNTALTAELTDANLVTWNNGTTECQLPNHYGNGYGPFASYSSHGCNQITSVLLSDLSLTADYVRSLTEIVREPNWDGSKYSFLINLNEGDIEDFSNVYSTAEIISRLTEDNITYIGWCSGQNKAASQVFVNGCSNNSGLVCIDDYVATGKGKYDKESRILQVNEIAKQISQRVELESCNKAMEHKDWYTFLDTQDFTFNVTQGASIDDGRWSVGYSATSFDDCVNNITDYPDLSDAPFDICGYYEIYYDHITDASNIVKIRIHKAPVAVVTAGKDTNGLVWPTNKSYDPENIDGVNTTIAAADGSVLYGIDTTKTKIEYRNTAPGAADEWITSQPTVQEGDDWLVRISVTDLDGTTVTATTQVAGSASGPGGGQSTDVAPYGSFDLSGNKFIKGVDTYVTVADKSYPLDDNSYTTNYALYKAPNYTTPVKTFDDTNFTSGTYDIPVADLAEGTYKLSLTAKSGTAVAPTVSRTFSVVQGYLITYQGGEGISNMPANKYKIKDEDFVIPTSKPIKANDPDGTRYMFRCWKDASGHEYNPGDKITGNAAVTLTPQWHMFMEYTADGVEKVYDGAPASISVSVTKPVSGAVIKYATSENGTYTTTNPQYTNPGTYPVYFKIEATDYYSISGQKSVIINKAEATVSMNAVSKPCDDINPRTYAPTTLDTNGNAGPAVKVIGSTDTVPTGTMTYTYYTDPDCTVPTTTDNSGATTEGGAPVKEGLYYVKGVYSGDNIYEGGAYAIEELEIYYECTWTYEDPTQDPTTVTKKGPIEEAIDDARDKEPIPVKIEIIHDCTFPNEFTPWCPLPVPENVTIEIPETITLTVPEGIDTEGKPGGIINHGTIDNDGPICGDGTIRNDGIIKNGPNGTIGDPNDPDDKTQIDNRGGTIDGGTIDEGTTIRGGTVQGDMTNKGTLIVDKVIGDDVENEDDGKIIIISHDDDDDPDDEPQPLPTSTPTPAPVPTPSPTDDDDAVTPSPTGSLTPTPSPTDNTRRRVTPAPVDTTDTDDVNKVPVKDKEQSVQEGDGTFTVDLTDDAIKNEVYIDDIKDVMDAVLTDEEKEALRNGEDISVNIDVVIEDEATENNEAVEKAIENLITDGKTSKSGKKIKINLTKSIGGGDPVEIKSSGQPIAITVSIPEDVKADGATYYVISDDGRVLAATLNNDGTITFETDDFDSEYTIVAIFDDEVPMEVNSGLDEDGGDREPVKTKKPADDTEDKSDCMMHWFDILAFLAYAVYLFVGNKKKRKEEFIGLGVEAVAVLLLGIAGSCALDLWMGIGALLLSAGCIPLSEMIKQDK